MAGLTHDHKRAFIRKMLEFTEENDQAPKDAGYDPSQRIGELTTLNDAQEQAEAEQLFLKDIIFELFDFGMKRFWLI